MKLLTQQLRAQLPPLRSTSNKESSEIKCLAKFFSPYSNWRWYVTEGEPVLNDQNEEIDFMFYGLVIGFEQEWGYFSLLELATAKYNGIVPAVERDLYWTPKPMDEVLEDIREKGYS